MRLPANQLRKEQTVEPTIKIIGTGAGCEYIDSDEKQVVYGIEYFRSIPLANQFSFSFERDRPDQDSVTGELIVSFQDYDYEYANELWVYSSTDTYRFKGLLIDSVIYVYENDIKFVSSESDNHCVRDHNDEEFRRFEEEYLEAEKLLRFEGEYLEAA